MAGDKNNEESCGTLKTFGAESCPPPPPAQWFNCAKNRHAVSSTGGADCGALEAILLHLRKLPVLQNHWRKRKGEAAGKRDKIWSVPLPRDPPPPTASPSAIALLASVDVGSSGNRLGVLPQNSCCWSYAIHLHLSEA